MKKTKMLALATATLLVALNAPVFANGNTPAKTSKQATKTVSAAGSEKVAPSPTASAPKTVAPRHSVHSMHKSHPKTAATTVKKSPTKGKTVTETKKSGTKS